MGLLNRDRGVVSKVVSDSNLPHLLMDAAKSTVQNAIDQQSTQTASTGAARHVGHGIGRPAMLVAGAAAGLTAASAVVSAARRKSGDA
jgi:hypothetical protein